MGENLGMKIVEMPVSDLVPYENNPRNNDGAVDAVAASIREFGFKVPIIVDKDNVIVAGHTRLKAAEKLGLSSVPVIRADDLTEDQIKAFRIADNKTAELAEWDFEKLEKELDELKKIDLSKMGFSEKDNKWFERNQRDGADREEGNDEYNEFLDKFEAKKTTDDCYTPDNIHAAVAEWVANEYGLNAANFVRPFYPGSDYQSFKYKPSSVVVDNPPFSIEAEIVNFYKENGIKFFLYAPSLTVFHYIKKGVTCICVGVSVEYENTARVQTSFLTNLEQGEVAARTAPDLYKAIKKANDENTKKAEIPLYVFPNEVATAAKLNYFSKYGQFLSVNRSECMHIGELDAMKAAGKSLYGDGILLSERAAAERAAAERAAAERAAAERAAAERGHVWQLSEREKEIVASLGKS